MPRFCLCCCVLGESKEGDTLSIQGCNYGSAGKNRTLPFLRKETAGRGVAAFKCARYFLNLPHTCDFGQLSERNFMSHIGFVA